MDALLEFEDKGSKFSTEIVEKTVSNVIKGLFE